MGAEDSGGQSDVDDVTQLENTVVTPRPSLKAVPDQEEKGDSLAEYSTGEIYRLSQFSQVGDSNRDAVYIAPEDVVDLKAYLDAAGKSDVPTNKNEAVARRSQEVLQRRVDEFLQNVQFSSTIKEFKIKPTPTGTLVTLVLNSPEDLQSMQTQLDSRNIQFDTNREESPGDVHFVRISSDDFDEMVGVDGDLHNVRRETHDGALKQV